MTGFFFTFAIPIIPAIFMIRSIEYFHFAQTNLYIVLQIVTFGLLVSFQVKLFFVLLRS